ncbi:MAG TPA: alpha/beta hydrolase [Chloroflexota bacterium]|nr:alpha/beta hydrolase [Chloroflexota bacterium]
MSTRTIETPRGTRVRVLDFGLADNTPLVYLHGLNGLLDDTKVFELLAERHHVYVPELPGYGESSGEDLLEDMLDFTLHGWDVVVALGIHRPILVGHSMGGMVAAEMACLAPDAVDKLVLVDAYGLWLEDEPIPDIFAFLPFEFGDYLFHDPERAAALLTGGTDAADPESLRDFFIGNARSLGTAGKMLFPIPNRRISKRLYRLTTETLVVWGEHDRLMSPAYARRWGALLPHSRVVSVADAGHMLPYEQPAALARAVQAFIP